MNDQIYWSIDDDTTIEYWASNGWGLIPNWKPWNIKREFSTACDGEKCARCNLGASHKIHLSGQGFAVADHKQQSWGWACWLLPKGLRLNQGWQEWFYNLKDVMRHERPTEMTGFDVIFALCVFRKGQLCPIGEQSISPSNQRFNVLNIRQHLASVNFNKLKVLNI